MSMRYCPWDGLLLIVDNRSAENTYRFRCVACPYVNEIARGAPVRVRELVRVKEQSDVLGGEDAWANAPQTEARCEACGNNSAYYMQIQTRSADEPMTIFLKCTRCKQQWKE
mmetsp:Transcript_12561/g.24343  ORF Transcript_12561/g.24343 Transcript_12561/m.24343 type:complete len:112 (-) Transcript_12561:521-856(-)|eukprot:CAMPEP_0171500122 /NCGR_PEP_ID=MMETSP0958-20121227/8808_1 /TAXON_ID=87120 /ORGANISM="Aurantiochytrium limacinum, Strain ATCCMYA-1381" /LENGTH=111 /DNA_ID=CAMNT_0012034753 /DNA_START=56 /DNA_END=391 /DNA_ORIENTATION=-